MTSSWDRAPSNCFSGIGPYFPEGHLASKYGAVQPCIKPPTNDNSIKVFLHCTAGSQLPSLTQNPPPLSEGRKTPVVALWCSNKNCKQVTATEGLRHLTGAQVAGTISHEHTDILAPCLTSRQGCHSHPSGTRHSLGQMASPKKWKWCALRCKQQILKYDVPKKCA